ncbi:MAG: hypothetical protein U1E76_14035 [Planctomycetota bacterium]
MANDEGAIEYTGLGDPARHATRDNIVVSLNSGTLEYKIPLIHKIPGRAHDIDLEMVFHSQVMSPGGKFGSFWALSLDHFLVLEFYDRATEPCGDLCSIGFSRTEGYRSFLNSHQSFAEYNGGRVTTWTNRDAIEGKWAFQGMGIVQGLASYNLNDCRLYKPDPLLSAGTFIPHPAAVGVATASAPSFGPLAIGNPADARPGFSDFVAPPGDFRVILPSCDNFYIRDPDGTIHEFEFFRWRRENIICAADAGGTAVPGSDFQGVRVQAIARKLAVISPNGDRIDYVYDDWKRLSALVDNYGRQISFLYDEAAPWRVVQISETTDQNQTRTTDFGYTDYDGLATTPWDQFLTSITMTAGTEARVWSFDYDYHIQPSRNAFRPAIENRLYLDAVSIFAPGDADIPQVHATFIDARADEEFIPPGGWPAWHEDRRVAQLSIGHDTSADIDGDGNSETLTAGGTISYNWDLGFCQEDTSVQVTDARGNITTHLFDWMGNEVSRTVSYTQYDQNGTPTTQQATTTFEYYGEYTADNPVDPAAPTSLLKRETTPNLKRIEYRYQANVDDEDGLSHYSRADYQNEGESPRDLFAQANLLTRTQIALDSSQIVERFTYEPVFNQKRTIVDPRGIVSPPDPELEASYTTTNFFDYQEGTGAAIEALASVWRIRLGDIPFDQGDQNGDSLTTQIFGNVVRTEYPPVTQGLQLGQKIEKLAYNDAGQEIYRIDGEGYRHTKEYYPFDDPEGNSINTADPPVPRPHVGGGYLKAETVDSQGLQLKTQYGYDSFGHQVWQRDPRNTLSVTLFNGLNLKTRAARGEVDQSGEPVGSEPIYEQHLFTYDLNDNLIQVQDFNNDPNTAASTEVANYVTTRLFYDGLNELRGERRERVKPGDPLRTYLTTYLERDLNGNVTRTVTPEGRTTTFSYDERNVVLQKRKLVATDSNPFDSTLPTTAGDHGDVVIDFTHDKIGNLTDTYLRGPAGADAHHHLEYDGFDRRTALVDPLGNRTEQSFDAASNITSVVKKGQARWLGYGPHQRAQPCRLRVR